MAYITFISSRTSTTPHSVAAFLTDEAVVLNLDPTHLASTMEMQSLYDSRVAMVKDRGYKSSNHAADIMSASLYNNSGVSSEPEEYEADEEAFDAVHVIASDLTREVRDV